jgi:hypothetical protein
MQVEIGNVVFTLRWMPYMKRTESAPAEGGDFEVVDMEFVGPVNDDDLPNMEDQAIAEAWDRMQGR